MKKVLIAIVILYFTVAGYGYIRTQIDQNSIKVKG